MKTPLTCANYSKAEKEAWDSATSKGCVIPETYELPYSLEEHSKISAGLLNWQVYHISFEDIKERFYDWKDMPKNFWRVLCDHEVPMSNFFADKRLARKEMEMYNVRHFTCMGNSENKLKPVLI